MATIGLCHERVLNLITLFLIGLYHVHAEESSDDITLLVRSDRQKRAFELIWEDKNNVPSDIKTYDSIEKVIDLEELSPEDAVETMYDIDGHHRGFVHNIKVNNDVGSDGIPVDDAVPMSAMAEEMEEGFPYSGVITSLLTFLVLIIGVLLFVWAFAKRKSACVLERKDLTQMYNPLRMEDGEIPRGSTVIR